MKNKKHNSVVILLGGVHGASANHAVREFRVKIYNTVDMLPGMVNGAGLADEVPGYLGNAELEEQLENLRSNIAICWHGEKVDVVMKEEDANG